MKKMIIAPHIDDEVLGCGGILDKDTFVLHCGVEDRDSVTSEERVKEMDEVRKEAGFELKLLKNVVNNYKAIDLIADVEKSINELKPEQAFIPFPSYNQDHRAVYDAALVALRPHDLNFFVKKVLIYEQPHAFFWSENKHMTFKPNYFVPIDIERKLRLYSLLKSQVRSFRSPDHVKALAKLRGGQSNCKHAEAFQILRWVD
jgi:N-acetylglucosamine malate deacetylase 1